jgi:hypothetical protein
MNNRTLIKFLKPVLIVLSGILFGLLAAGSPPQTALSFSAQYVRTNGYHDGRAYPAITIIRSKAELQAYYNANKKDYDLERHARVASDMTAGFLNACDRYDASYFKDHDLILLLLEEGSGSIRHQVTAVSRQDQRLLITVNRPAPKMGTADMAEWHLLIEVPKSAADGMKVEAQFTDKRPAAR